MLRKIQTLFPYLVVTAITVALFMWPTTGDSEVASPDNAEPKAESIPVRTVRVIRGDLADTFETTGTADSWAQVSVSSQLDGTLTSVEVETGTPVRSGQLLAQLDDRLLRADMKQAQAALASASEQLSRVEQLAERRLADQNRLQAAMTQKQMAQIALERLETVLTLTSLASPIDGVITSERRYGGESVEKGSPLFSIADVSRLRISTKIPEAVARKLRVGSRAAARIDALGGREIRTSVWRIHPVSDPASHQVVVELDAGSVFPMLQPGNLVTVAFRSDTRTAVLTLDRSALPDVTTETDVDLFRVNAGRAERRHVKLGLVLEDRIEIVDGLAEGDLVITGTTGALQDGDHVRTLEQNGATSEVR